MTAFAATWAALWAGAAFLSGTALGYRLRRHAADTCGDFTACTTAIGKGMRRDYVARCSRAAGHRGLHVGKASGVKLRWARGESS